VNIEELRHTSVVDVTCSGKVKLNGLFDATTALVTPDADQVSHDAAPIPALPMKPGVFEMLCGRGASKKWKASLRLESNSKMTVGNWLEIRETQDLPAKTPDLVEQENEDGIDTYGLFTICELECIDSFEKIQRSGVFAMSVELAMKQFHDYDIDHDRNGGHELRTRVTGLISKLYERMIYTRTTDVQPTYYAAAMAMSLWLYHVDKLIALEADDTVIDYRSLPKVIADMVYLQELEGVDMGTITCAGSSKIYALASFAFETSKMSRDEWNVTLGALAFCNRATIDNRIALAAMRRIEMKDAETMEWLANIDMVARMLSVRCAVSVSHDTKV
jgi:hypothetical protein